MSTSNNAVIDPRYILDQKILTLPESVDISKVLQPNGIDLSVKSIRLIERHGLMVLGDSVPTQHLSGYELESLQGRHYYQDKEYKNADYFDLEAGCQYSVETGYALKLPQDMVAYIFTRSTLNRNGILVGSGLWDSGYNGPVGTTLYPFNNLRLVLPCRVAQIVFLRAESAHLYSGVYNNKI